MLVSRIMGLIYILIFWTRAQYVFHFKKNILSF